MKPIELLEGIKIEYLGDLRAYSSDKELLKKYLDKDCVIAYNKENLDNTFLIKGVKGNFGFVYLKTHLYGTFSLYRIPELKDAVKMLGDKPKVLNKKEFTKIKREIILKSL